MSGYGDGRDPSPLGDEKVGEVDEVHELREEVEVLKHQLDWFKRQLFG